MQSKAIGVTGLLASLFIASAAQGPGGLTFDSAIPSSSIIREDLFAGFLWGEKDGDQRFLRGERNLEILLTERPQDRPVLTAWKAGIALKRATDALRAGRTDEFEREHRNALNLYAEAARLGPGDVAVMALTGAGFALFADQLPDRHRKHGWDVSYKAYRSVWQVQGADIEKLPLHFKGELLAGLAQTAQRTGNEAESARFVEKILTTMTGTPYAAVAKKWVDSPAEVGRTRLVCQTCHDAGRLTATRSAIRPSTGSRHPHGVQ